MRKPYLVVSLVLAVAIAGVLLWRLRPQSEPEPVVVPPLGSAPFPPQQLERAKVVFQSERTALPAKATSELSPECKKMWGDLRKLDVIQTLSSAGGPAALPGRDHGCTNVPPEVADTHEYFNELCGALKTMNKETTARDVFEHTRSGCYSVMTIYRAQITEWATKDIPLEKISDPKTLADKAVARFVTNPALAADAADRLLEVEPNFSPAARLSALGRFLHARAVKGSDAEEQVWEKSKDSTRRAKELSPEAAQEMAELEAWTEASRYSDPAGMRRKGEAMVTENPKSGLGYFFVSYAEFKAGNRTKMIEAMKSAVAVDPSPRYKEALRRIEATPEGQDPGVYNARVSQPLDQLLPPPS